MKFTEVIGWPVLGTEASHTKVKGMSLGTPKVPFLMTTHGIANTDRLKLPDVFVSCPPDCSLNLQEKFPILRMKNMEFNHDLFLLFFFYLQSSIFESCNVKFASENNFIDFGKGIHSI